MLCMFGSVRFGSVRFGRLGSARLGSARLGSARLGSARLGSARLGSARLGSAWLGSARLGSARLGSARLGSARLGSARLGSARLGSARLGSVRFGSVRFAWLARHSAVHQVRSQRRGSESGEGACPSLASRRRVSWGSGKKSQLEHVVWFCTYSFPGARPAPTGEVLVLFPSSSWQERGDHYITVKVNVPRDLSGEDEKKVEELRDAA